MIRVLTNDNDFDIIEITTVKRPKDFFPRRINRLRLVLLLYKID